DVAVHGCAGLHLPRHAADRVTLVELIGDADEPFDDVPLVDLIRRAAAVGGERVGGESFADPRADRDRGQEARMAVALAYVRDELVCETFRDWGEAERVDRAFRFRLLVGGGEEGEGRPGERGLVHGGGMTVSSGVRVLRRRS